MADVLPCPECGEVPLIGYACGEYFVLPLSKPVGTCICSSFYEMHASEEREIEAWNRYVIKKKGEAIMYIYKKDTIVSISYENFCDKTKYDQNQVLKIMVRDSIK